MESIMRVRQALAGAFLLVLGVIAALVFYPFENQWILWSARGVAGFASIFATAVVTVLLTTYFPADKENPWESGYFCYMRNLWGYQWGGWSHPYHISVCPAVQYTWLTLFFWFLFVGALGFLTYHAFVIGLGGFEASPLWDSTSNIFAFVVFFGFLFNIVMFTGFKVLFSEPVNLSSRVDAMFGAFVSVLALLTAVVAPIQSFGALAVGRIMFWIAAAVTGSASVGFLFYVIVKMPLKGVKGLRNTAPGQLFSELHETLCPEIVEKYTPPEEA